MGFFNILAVMLRRWYISLFAVVLASGVWVSWMDDGGCFTTSTVVTFTWPAHVIILPSSGVEDFSVIAFAEVVANEINEGQPAPPFASKEASLYGSGVRRGVIVGLPDSGGQWASWHTRAEIEIQIVGRTYEEVQNRQTSLLDRVFQITREQQTSSPADGRIRAVVLPMTTGIDEITSSRLSRLAALAALLISAMLLSGGGSIWLERRWPKVQGKGAVRPMEELSET